MYFNSAFSVGYDLAVESSCNLQRSDFETKDSLLTEHDVYLLDFNPYICFYDPLTSYELLMKA